MCTTSAYDRFDTHTGKVFLDFLEKIYSSFNTMQIRGGGSIHGGVEGSLESNIRRTLPTCIQARCTIRSVAGVAVADSPESVMKLSLDEESRIRTWLEHIGETDQAIIDEALDKYHVDLKHRQHYLKRSEEVPGS